MNTRFFIIVLLLLAASAAGCGTNGAGTGVSNPPTVPSTSFVPDFDEAIDVSAITDDSGDVSSLVKEITRPEEAYLSGPAAHWQDVFLEGPVTWARIFREHFFEFGEELAVMANADADFEISEDVAVVFVGARLLGDHYAPWVARVRMLDSGLIRVVIVNRIDGLVWGYYLFSLDEEGNPVRGFFAFVNYHHLDNPLVTGIRFMGLAFDFSEGETPRLVTSLDFYDERISQGVSFLLLQECLPDEENCLGELLLVTSAPPERVLSENSVRFKWNRASHAVCLANITYDEDVNLQTTQEFTGPDVPAEDEVTEGGCELVGPSWNERIFSTDDLPLRYEDTSTPGGFARIITGDAGDEDSWESALSESLLDDWLEGVF